MKMSQKIRNQTTMWSRNLTSGCIFKGNEFIILKNICISLFLTVWFIIAKVWCQPKCLSVNGWLKKMWCTHTCTDIHILTYSVRTWMTMVKWIQHKMIVCDPAYVWNVKVIQAKKRINNSSKIRGMVDPYQPKQFFWNLSFWRIYKPGEECGNFMAMDSVTLR